jgi:hypothetical protein
MLFSCGKRPFLESRDEDRRKLEALRECTVMSWSASSPVPASRSPASRLACERNAREDLLLRRAGVGDIFLRLARGLEAVLELVGEERRGVDELVQVLEPVLAVLLGAVMLLEAALLEHFLDELGQPSVSDDLRSPSITCVNAASDVPLRPPRRPLRDVHEASHAAFGRFLELLDRRAPMPRGGKFTTRVNAVSSSGFREPQVRERVLDLLALEEAQVPIDPIGRRRGRASARGCATGRWSDRGAPSPRAPCPRGAAFFTSSTMKRASSSSFAAAYTRSCSPLPSGSPQVLPEARLVLRDDRVRRVEDVALRAVVLLELHDLLHAKSRTNSFMLPISRRESGISTGRRLRRRKRTVLRPRAS